MVQQLNRTEEILDIHTASFNATPALETNHELDRIMTKIRLNGGETIEDILIAMQKIELDFPKYRNDFRYKVLLPGPPWLVKNIKIKLSSSEITKKLFKALNIDWMEISWCYIFYFISLGLLISTPIAIVLAMNGSHGTLMIIPLLIASIAWHSFWFKKTIDATVFVKVYEQICDVLKNNYIEHCNYVQKVLALPEQVMLRHQEMDRNKIFIGIEAEENRHRKELELKHAESLQGLAALVAINQATTEEEITAIRNQTKLNYLEVELGIRDQVEARKRSHESALILLNGMAECLVERAKALAEDDREQRNIRYQFQLINGIRGRFQDIGADAMSEEELYEAIKKMMDMMSEPVSTKSTTENDGYDEEAN